MKEYEWDGDSSLKIAAVKVTYHQQGRHEKNQSLSLSSQGKSIGRIRVTTDGMMMRMLRMITTRKLKSVGTKPGMFQTKKDGAVRYLLLSERFESNQWILFMH